MKTMEILLQVLVTGLAPMTSASLSKLLFCTDGIPENSDCGAYNIENGHFHWKVEGAVLEMELKFPDTQCGPFSLGCLYLWD